jgi:hypothetical protein
MIYLYLFGTCFHFIYVFMIIGKYMCCRYALRGYYYLQSYENILYHYNECYMCRVCVAHENNL